jgi:hypothetical protein
LPSAGRGRQQAVSVCAAAPRVARAPSHRRPGEVRTRTAIWTSAQI